MKIGILSTNPRLYSTKRLMAAGKERGHEMAQIDHRRCYMNITSHAPGIHFNGESIKGVDAVIPRIGASVSFYGTAVVRQFEMMGVYSINESVAMTRSCDKVVASMKRQGREGEFRSNLHRGGSATLIKITPEERSTAVRSAKVMGLNVAGVDLLRSNHGPVVMEVNSSPGLEGIESAIKKDIAVKIIQFIEKNAQKGKIATRGKG